MLIRERLAVVFKGTKRPAVKTIETRTWLTPGQRQQNGVNHVRVSMVLVHLSVKYTWKFGPHARSKENGFRCLVRDFA